jgi:hypothetical protein
MVSRGQQGRDRVAPLHVGVGQHRSIGWFKMRAISQEDLSEPFAGLNTPSSIPTNPTKPYGCFIARVFLPSVTAWYTAVTAATAGVR